MTTNLILNNRPNRKGLYCIFIRITKNRKHYSTSSEIYVKKTEFDKKAKYGKWIVKNLDRDRLNTALKTKIASIERTYQLNEDVTPQRAIRADSFFKYAYEFIKKYDPIHQGGTLSHFNSKLKKLKAFGGDLKFSDITPGFLREYETYLTKKGRSINTISQDLKKIRTILIAAEADRIITFNPFKAFKIRTAKTKKERLTMEEVEAIEALDLENSHHDARNIFLFCIYCSGMRIGDAMRLKWSNVSGDKLRYSMNKTKDEIPIRLNDQAVEIINQYDRGTKYIFPYLEECSVAKDEYKKVNSGTTVVNNCLVSIAEMAGIDKHITTHVARHTYSQLAINAKVNPRTLQKALGHESFSTTENYISELNFDDVDDINEKIFG